MKQRIEQVSRWCYEGIWGVLTRWFQVPDQPPTLPSRPDESVESFRPAPGFLRYLKWKFWIGLTLFDGAILILWLFILAASPVAGLLLAGPALFIAVVPDILAYLAVHLRYDTTWYVISQRSLRIRRGIWVIHETTITFENVQNVTVNQGPVQRWFGIADVLVDTAGGGGDAQQAHQGGLGQNAHQGLIEGIADAPRIRDLLLDRLRRSRTAGLGDDATDSHSWSAAWSLERLAALREVRDAAVELAAD
jgi:membrane protein YdbS with pleckstrin-like domain